MGSLEVLGNPRFWGRIWFNVTPA